MSDGGLNVAKGLGHGLMGMFGLGQFYDKTGDAQKTLSTTKDNLNNMFQKQSLIFDKLDVQKDSAEEKALSSSFQVIQEQAELTNDQLWASIKMENTFLLVLFIFVFIMFFYILAEKECC